MKYQVERMKLAGITHKNHETFLRLEKFLKMSGLFIRKLSTLATSC